MAYTYTDFLRRAGISNTLKDFDLDELRLAKPYPEYGIATTSLKQDANTAATSAQRALANEAAAQLKASYNGFVGSKDQEIEDILGQIGSFPDFSYDEEAPTYENKYEQEQDEVLGQIGSYPDFTYDQQAPTYQNPYEQLQQQLLDKILNREDFTWSKDTDPVFGEYQKQYLREGERATANALAQAAAASGGQTSSYAATAAAQAGNYYAAQLSDKIPELYNQAYQRYLSEYEMMANDLGLVNTQQQLGYQEYLDKLGQYNTDKNFAYQQYMDDYNKLLSYLDAINGQEQMDYQEYLDRLGQYNGDKDFAYQQYLDNYNKLQSYLGNLQDVNADEYQKYLDQIAQEQYEREWERDQQRYEQEQQQALQKQNQQMAQAQVDAILQAGGTPSSALVSQSRYSQEYINSMVNYYRQQAAKAASSYRSYSSGGSSGSKSSSSSSSSTSNKKTTTTSTGLSPMGLAQMAQGAISSGLTVNDYVAENIKGNTVYAPGYGAITYDKAEQLVNAGILKITGIKNGQVTFARL